MPKFYSPHTSDKTKALIMGIFGVSPEYAQRLAANVLDGIESHGGNPEDWDTVNEAVRVVVAAWINDRVFTPTVSPNRVAD
jgi:alkanesulfonate monooxygenase SsuD/methylene tetrahydromethanopterin reductase-like flavin-dependent oxidoreductase (luciferase family)